MTSITRIEIMMSMNEGAGKLLVKTWVDLLQMKDPGKDGYIE